MWILTKNVETPGHLAKTFNLAQLSLQHEVTQQTAALANQTPEYTHSW